MQAILYPGAGEAQAHSKFPVGAIAGIDTVTRVDVTGDLSHAYVFVSPLGDEDERARAIEGLESAAGYLRTLVAKVLTTRSVPELHIELDRGLEHAQRIEQILAELRREEQR